MKTITKDELLHISAETNTRLEAFVKAPKLNIGEMASLARKLLEDMARPENLIQNVIMMQTLQQLREDELK